MRIKFLLNAWKLHMGLLKKPLLSLIGFTATAALLGGVVVAMRGNFSPEKDVFQGVTIAVCDSGEDERISMALKVLSSMEEVGEYASFVEMEEEQAREKLLEGEVSAVVVMPAGFIDGVLYGENFSPKLILNESNPLENMLILSLAQGVTGMLSSAQSGIYAIMDSLPPGASPSERSQALWEANMEYISWTLSRSDLFAQRSLSAAGSLSLVQHYLLMGALWFAALTAPLLFRVYSAWEEQGVLARLKSTGAPIPGYLLSKWLAGLTANLLLSGGVLLLLAAAGKRLGLRMDFSAAFFGFFLLALFVTSWGYCCANLCRTPVSQTLLCLLLTAAGMVAAGGAIPTLLLPPVVAVLEKFSPFYYLEQCLMPLFYKDGAVGAGGVVLLFSLIVPIAVAFLTFKRLKKEGRV